MSIFLYEIEFAKFIIRHRSNSIKTEQSRQNFRHRKSPENSAFPSFFSILKFSIISLRTVEHDERL